MAMGFLPSGRKLYSETSIKKLSSIYRDVNGIESIKKYFHLAKNKV